VADWQRQDTLIIHPGATAKSLIRDFHPGWALGVAGERSATPRYANYTPVSHHKVSNKEVNQIHTHLITGLSSKTNCTASGIDELPEVTRDESVVVHFDNFR
jgi:hypothetical protein